MGEVVVLLASDRSCHSQGLHSDIYYLLIIQHGEVSCILIVNVDRHLIRDLEKRLFPCHGEGAFYILKSLELH